MKHIILFLPLLLSCSCILKSGIDAGLPNKSIVLTFDDGPNESYNTTNNLLDVLKKHNVNAYFCLMGINAEKYPTIVKRIHKEGHIIVNHGYNELPIITKNENALNQDILKWNQIVCYCLDTTCEAIYYRPAFGFYNTNLLKLLKKNNKKILPVSFYGLDAEVGPNKKLKILHVLEKGIAKSERAIIVIHDGKDSYTKLEKEISKDKDCKYNRSWVPEITDSLIVHMKRKGYKFTIFKGNPQG